MSTSERMDENEVLKLMERARSVARKRGYTELADDFAQEVFISHARGWHQTIDQALSDFVRREHGNTRTPGGLARRLAKTRTVSLDEPIGEEEGGTLLHECIPGAESDPDAKLDHGRSAELFTGTEAVLYDRIYLEEESQKEVAESMGVTQGRVSQLLKPIKTYIQHQAVMAEVWDRYQNDPEYSKIQIDWIRL